VGLFEGGHRGRGRLIGAGVDASDARETLGWTAGARPEGLQEFVSQRIRDAILSGRVPAGERLYPSRIARDLGVSHIPVREALATLDATGHVRHVPRSGYFVADLSYEVIIDTYRMRDLLEGEAHRLVIGRLPAERLERMRRLNDQMVDALRSGDIAEFVRLNRAFHFEPYADLPSDWPVRFLSHLWDVAARYQAAMATVRLSKPVLVDQHAAILAAFEDGDLAALESAMSDHRRVTLDVMAALRDTEGGTVGSSESGEESNEDSVENGRDRP
jgi:DNA-binding GntR family transcriptional regulator